MATLINDSFKKVGFPISNLPTGGSIGTAATTIDLYSTFLINQTTADQTISLPNPSDIQFSDIVNIVNIGTADFKVLGGKIVEKQSNAQAVWTGSVWNFLISGTLLQREGGVVLLNNQTFATNVYTASSNGIFNIPSAGIWRLRYFITTDGTGANANNQFRIVDSLGTLIAGSERTRGGGSTISEGLSSEPLEVTTTGPTTFTLMGRNGGSGSVTILATANSSSTISWEKVSGFLPFSPTLSGNIIAIQEKVASNVAVAFDNLLMRWNGATDRFEIATNTGTLSLEWVTKINYGTQSTVVNGGAGVDSTFQGTPIIASTTFAVIGDAGLLGVEDRIYNIWTATGLHYRVNAIRKGTIATDGWATFVVEKIGTTASQIYSAGQGIDLTSNVITNVGSTYGFATRTATQTVTPANTFMSIIWGTTIGNNVTLANTATPFTITQTGTYRVVFTASHDDNGLVSGSFQQQRITVNGAAVGMTQGWDVGTNLRASNTVEYIGSITAGQTVGGQVSHSTINGNTVANCTLSIQRIL
jgi:hypothetical protein